jgi:serine/threonine-protein kinase PknK
MEIPGYRNLTVLGRGGFSTVYRAVQESVQRDVALKVLGVHMAGADAKVRFSRECATNGRVGTHPNIVTLFDSGFADDGSPYLAMQLCSGGSLSERLRATGALPVSEVLRIGVKISAALQYAHSAGVLHRDIKPENILISDFGEPELADFGISSVDDQRLSTVTASSFTINHAAPEALAGAPSSVSTDVYSLCSTLYTLVAGHTPFTAPSSTALVALVNMVMNQPAPSTGRADVPDSLERLLAAGLSKTPALRPVDARAVGTALQQIQGELRLPVTEFPSAPPPLTFSPTQTFSPPGSAVPGGAGVAGVAGAGLAGVGVAGAGLAGAGVAGAGPAGALDTGNLPSTGAMPPPGTRRPMIDTGARPAAQPPVPLAPTSLDPALPPAGTGQWGAWASEVGTGQARNPGPADDGHFHPVPPVIIPPVDRAGPAGPGRGPDRRAWWIAAIVLTVLIVGAGVYFLAIRKSSQAGPNPPAPIGSSAARSPATSPSPRSSATPTKKSSTSPSTSRSAPTTSASTSRSSSSPTKVATAPAVITSFGSSTLPAGNVECATPGSMVTIAMTWQTQGATRAWIGIDTNDASKGPAAPVATSSDNYGLQYACSAASHVFTLTVANADGTTISASVTYTSRFPPSTTPAPTTPTTPTTPSSPATSSSTTKPTTPAPSTPVS